MPPLAIGDPAPEFEAVAHSGRTIRLSEYLGRQAVVLYFYPRDFTPGCTAQACSFRDAYEAFSSAGAAVIGVSSDTSSSHTQFAAAKHLPFELVSDPEQRLRRLYQVPKTWGVLPGRVTYVIDRAGVIRHIFNSQWQAARHAAEALRVVQGLA